MITGNPELRRSEADLLVFISSVMNDELLQARRIAEQTISCFEIGRSWAFEYTPASSEPPTSTYLRKVAESDFVVWIVGSETTQPVVDEIDTCVAAGGRLLVFKLPTQQRDSRTSDLLSRVQPLVKWRDVPSLDQLGLHIKSALSDELIIALRMPEAPGRALELKRSLAESYYRCKVIFRASGIDDKLASELAADQTIGCDLKIEAPGLHVVVGPQGVGKTLACHRLFQLAIRQALRDSFRPFPVFVAATEITGSLRETIDQRCQRYADIKMQGVFVIVDGVDERGSHEATNILRELEVLAGAHPNVTAVVTVRRLPGIEIRQTPIELPGLEVGQQLYLIERVSGKPLKHDPHYWPESIRMAARLPLFAIMIGVWFRKDRRIHDLAVHSLVEAMARRALRESGFASALTYGLLKLLAAEVTDRGAPVFPHDVVKGLVDEQKLADSRLVLQTGGRFDFSLPIFREWYAARAITEGTVGISEIDLRSDRWMRPISIAVHSQSACNGRAIMHQVASRDVSVACGVLSDYDSTEDVSVGSLADRYTEKEVGEQIREAMHGWAEALGDLFLAIGPVNMKGELGTVGVKLDDDTITIAWYWGAEKLPPVIEFSGCATSACGSFRKPSWKWPWLEERPILRTEVFSWVVTRDYLARRLKRVLRDYRFAYQSPVAVCELTWAVARAVVNRGRSFRGAIAISIVLARIGELFGGNVVSWRIGGQTFSRRDIQIVRVHLIELVRQGKQRLFDPWLPSASEGNYRLLETTAAIYLGALEVYQNIVECWFAPFSGRLQLYRLLPVRLEGRLSVASEREPRGQAFLSWFPMVLPSDEKTQVAFELGCWDSSPEGFEERFRSQREALARYRSGDVRSVAVFQTSTLIDMGMDRPATELAYEWLSKELRRLGWVGR